MTAILTRSTGQLKSLSRHYMLPDAELTLWPNWLPEMDSLALLQQLVDELSWQQPAISLYGKSVVIPRQQVWMGEPHCRYRYSGTWFTPVGWHPRLQALAAEVSRSCQQTFNCVLLNYYRNGQQHMGWHADNEPELGAKPVIASLSLGQTRRFDLKHRQTDDQLQLSLTNGSLLLMQGACQQYWQHRLPKQSRAISERINLTFRYIPAAV
ncbi:MAG: alpha-ketoglutarate-dependent dioxygenase AlkB [Alkalimonas sp.]|nr:alpha-ketoglutarate-dependent dioxygenase AlkB [Alkalimonas sp.]